MTCVRQGKALEETGLTLLCDQYLKIISHDTERGAALTHPSQYVKECLFLLGAFLYSVKTTIHSFEEEMNFRVSH